MSNRNDTNSPCCGGQKSQDTPKLSDKLDLSNDIMIKKSIRDGYGSVAEQLNQGCGCSGNQHVITMVEQAKILGYSEDELSSIPDLANLGLGCGNPTALASIQEGEVVVDLGSGGGIDCFLAAKKVGPTGHVIGVDMTPQMLERARSSLIDSTFKNVEFRLGEIEHLPIADNSVDLIISNCVINLSTNKDQVFREAYRVLKLGGRMMISDIILTKELPEKVKDSIASYVGCVAGAMLKDDYLGSIKETGFSDVEIISERTTGSLTKHADKKKDDKPKIIVGGKEIEHNLSFEDLDGIEESIISVNVQAKKL
ncbi:arsenite methyltransferase [Candidatus Lokiarchaeum ossiferum]|uniref:arsenite methyltransferase n=1 Tax=Candidatus Lokiarchaeum ossiferum TaxID=2951803 RepID=UPI00352E668C